MSADGTAPTDSSLPQNAGQRCAFAHERVAPVELATLGPVITYGPAKTHKRCSRCCTPSQVLPIEAFAVLGTDAYRRRRNFCFPCDAQYTNERKKARQVVQQEAIPETTLAELGRLMLRWRKTARRAGLCAVVDPLRAAL